MRRIILIGMMVVGLATVAFSDEAAQQKIEETRAKIKARMAELQVQLDEIDAKTREELKRQNIDTKKKLDAIFEKAGADLKENNIDTELGQNTHPTRPSESYPVKKGWERLKVKGDSLHNGSADPSLAYDENGVGWMSYSRVKIPHVNTRLAKSTDHGKTWKFVQKINTAHKGQSFHKGKVVKGTYDFETSSIVYDPDDKGREWKIFYLKYITAKINPFKIERIYNNGFIGYRYTSDPEGKWSDEIPVFVQGPFIDQNIPGTINLTELHPDLKKITYFTEPGALVHEGVLYLSLDARPTYHLKGFEHDRVILVASKDHGRTWEYVGTATTHEDSKGFGFVTFTGSSLVAANGKVYLFTSPSGTIKPPYKGHVGTYIFEFEDIKRAKLKRDRKGKLIVQKHIKPQWEKGGQAHYDEQNTGGGVVIPQQNDSARPDPFRLFSTHDNLADL